MAETPDSLLHSWESFYVIVGSSAAALTGLMFVVIALIADHSRRVSGPLIGAYSTPNVVHFCSALLVSAILSAPWHGLTGPAIALAATGVAGLIYTAIVARRARGQTGYKPELEDWLWHAVLPLLAYAAIVTGAGELATNAHPALFALGAATVLLVFIGIHNAWDSVTYITVQQVEGASSDKDQA